MIDNHFSSQGIYISNMFLSGLFNREATSIFGELNSGVKFSGLKFKRNY